MDSNNDALLQEMYESILELHSKMDVLTSSVQNLSKKQKDIEKSAAKMNAHIDFVESVYDNMKYPINYICGTINSISNNNTICNEDLA